MLQRIQKLGGFLAGMVIPNIGAFIAWGLITALFIPTGWLAKTGLDWDWGEITGNTVGPMIKYLLPVLIAYTGGKMIHGHRGGVLGAVAAMGVIGGASFELASGATGDPPQFLGAMLIGPLAGWVMMKVDAWLEDRTPSGFEMLYNNFSQGISGVVMAMLGYVIIGPIMSGVARAFGNMVEGITDAGLLPLADLPIEVGKILFLNNAINHGVLTPLGTTDAAESGRSIYYMLESNPGPGLGLLLAFWVAGKGLAKLSAPGAIIIHFLGGIHEVYFPYVPHRGGRNERQRGHDRRHVGRWNHRRHRVRHLRCRPRWASLSRKHLRLPEPPAGQRWACRRCVARGPGRSRCGLLRRNHPAAPVPSEGHGRRRGRWFVARRCHAQHSRNARLEDPFRKYLVGTVTTTPTRYHRSGERGLAPPTSR